MADDAEANERDAMEKLEAAEVIAGDASLGEARRMLAEPGAKSAANALLAIRAVPRNYEDDSLNAIKEAERKVRDVVALRCRSRREPGNRDDRDAWLRTAEEAFGHFWDRELRDVLLLAYSKVPKNRPFPSNNQLATERRGRSRPRRERNSGPRASSAPPHNVDNADQRQEPATSRSVPPPISSARSNAGQSRSEPWRVAPAMVPSPEWALALSAPAGEAEDEARQSPR